MSEVRAAYTSLHHGTPPQLETADAKHWITRGTNFVVVTTSARSGALIEQDDLTEESMILLPPSTRATVSSGKDEFSSEGNALFIAPPGRSAIRAHNDGLLYRIFSSRAERLAAMADNASSHAVRNDRVAAPKNWPDPVGGFRLRHYSLDNFVRSDTIMRIFRSTNLMVNIFLSRKEPRDPSKLTPHSHNDIEQGSLALAGRYIHHMRYPWGADRSTWRDDEHDEIGSPSLIIIPPTVVHTSQSVGSECSQLVDIFSPPRADFSMKPGLVCNADEYPMPHDVAALVDAKGE